MAWVRGNNSGIACRRGREKVVQATPLAKLGAKTRRFLHSLDREGPGVGEGPGRRTDLSYVAALGQRAGAGAVPLLLPHSSCMRVVGGGPMEALGHWGSGSLSHRPGLCDCHLLECLSSWG